MVFPTHSLLGTTHERISFPFSDPSPSRSSSLSNLSFSASNHSLSRLAPDSPTNSWKLIFPSPSPSLSRSVCCSIPGNMCANSSGLINATNSSGSRTPFLFTSAASNVSRSSAISLFSSATCGPSDGSRLPADSASSMLNVSCRYSDQVTTLSSFSSMSSKRSAASSLANDL